MRKYIVQKHQSLIDIAVQLYGNVDALPELLVLNPEIFGLKNECDLGAELRRNSRILYDDTSVWYNKLAVEARAGEILATFTENTVLVTLPDPDPEPVYEFHEDTLAFLDAVDSINVSLAWEDYFPPADAIMLDRFVRDLHGEPNDEYATESIWGKFEGMYPMMGSTSAVQALNLADLGNNLLLSTSGLSHTANRMITDGSTGQANTNIIDGDLVGDEKVSIGVAFSNFMNLPTPMHPNGFMGTLSLYVRTWSGNYDAQVTTAGTFGTTTHYQANDYLHLDSDSGSNLQGLYKGSSGLLIGSKPHTAGTCSGNNILIGSTGAGIKTKADYHLAYVGYDLVEAQRKSLMNSVNYFLWQKGLRASFTAIA